MLWIGERLCTMEKLAIRSFLANGHAVDLYCYDHVDGIPEGTTIRDANKILPRTRVFGYAEGFAQGSVAVFSNFFRYKLLLEKGGWWVDTDVVCLRPFDLEDDRLWASERADPPRELIVSTSIIKTPPRDALMAWAWDACQGMNTASVSFGQIGPRLLQAGVDALGVHRFMRPHTFFSPIAFYDWAKIIDGSQIPCLGPESYAVHLWNQMWSANHVDKDAEFPIACLYEQLKRRFLST
jgi:Glycosyltransferase sugar-binding region containing DXD motif